MLPRVLTRASSAFCLIVAAIVALEASPALAASSQDVFPKYSLTAWGPTDGLSSGTVWALAQDADGYLWLGTDMGLVRFDGVGFSRWVTFGQTQLPRAPIRALRVTRDGSLWIGFGSSKGVSRLVGRHVQNYTDREGMPANDVTAIVEDPSGAVWAAGSAGLMRFSGDRWAPLQQGSGLPAGSVFSASIDREGGLIVGTSSGVFRKRAGRASFEPIEILDGIVSIAADFSREFGGDVVRAVVEDHAGHVWVTDPTAGFRGTDRWQRSTEKGRGAALLTDKQGDLWVGTWAQGLWRVTRDRSGGGLRIQRATEFESLYGNQVRSLLEDREGNIWAGTLDGLHRLSPAKVASITNIGLIVGLGATRDGRMWFRTVDDVFEFTSGAPRKRDELRKLTRNLYRGFDVDPRGTVWVSTRSDLLRIDGQRVAAVSLGGVSLRSINTIASDRRSGLWIHDVEQGLFHLRDDRLEISPLPPELARAPIESIFVDNTERAWLSFADGRLATIDRDGRVVVHDTSDSVGVYRAMYQDSHGAIWLGATDGLSKYEHGRFLSLHSTEAFPADSIASIVEDEAGYLWLGAASGVLRIDRADFERAASTKATGLRHGFYDTSDGIAGTARWFGKQGAARAPDGRLWFVTSRGISILDPRVLSQSRPTAPVNIEAVIANGQRLEALQDMSLPARTARLEFDYAMPTLTSPLKTRFKYRLEGFDNDWVFAGTRRQAFYTGVRPGSYRFQVVAGNSEGDWAEPGAEMAISVPPVFYQTGWFLLSSALALGGVVASAWRLHLRRLRREFSFVLGERVRLSREIHDTLLQSLLGVALQCDALANDLGPSATEAKEDFHRLRRDVEDQVREVRQAIWNLRSPILDRHDLAAALRFVGQQAVAGTPMEFSVRVEGTPRQFTDHVEGQLLRIGQEAVINAVRHSYARHINVDLTYGSESIAVRVADDGRGFAPEHVVPEPDSHYGLLSMRERAEAAGGRFSIVSGVGQGTIVETVVATSAAEAHSHE